MACVPIHRALRAALTAPGAASPGDSYISTGPLSREAERYVPCAGRGISGAVRRLGVTVQVTVRLRAPSDAACRPVYGCTVTTRERHIGVMVVRPPEQPNNRTDYSHPVTQAARQPASDGALACRGR